MVYFVLYGFVYSLHSVCDQWLCMVIGINIWDHSGSSDKEEAPHCYQDHHQQHRKHHHDLQQDNQIFHWLLRCYDLIVMLSSV